MPYLLIEESLYSMCGTVIYLITIPNVEESGEFGGYFHNRHGSYFSWTCIPWRIWHLEVQSNELIHPLSRMDETINDGSSLSKWLRLDKLPMGSRLSKDR